MSVNNRHLTRLLVALFALLPIFGGPGWLNAVNGSPTASTVGVQTAIVYSNMACFVEDTFLTIQEQAHSTLFPEAYSSDHNALTLSAPVTRAGTVTGTSHSGSPFQIQIVVASPLPLSGVPGLTQSQIDAAAAMGLTFTSVVGIASSSQGSVAVTGLAFSGTVEGVQQSRLLIGAIVDPGSAIFQPLLPLPGPATLPTLSQNEIVTTANLLLNATSYEKLRIVTAGPTCTHCSAAHAQAIADAQQTYDQAVASAEATYEAAVAAAQATRNAVVAGCHATYVSAMESENAWYVAQMIGCHGGLVSAMIACASVGTFFGFFTFGAALALCVIAAHAAYAWCVASVVNEHESDVAAIKAAFTACKAAADAALNAAVLAALNAKLMAIIAAQNAQTQANLAAQAAYDACIADCIAQGNTSKDTTAIEVQDNVAAVVNGMYQ